MFVLKAVALLSTYIDHSKNVSPRSGREERGREALHITDAM